VPGALGTGDLGLTSVAVARRSDSATVYAAGVSGDPERLSVGTLERGLKPTTLTGALTRPSWAAWRDEVWTAASGRVYHVSSSGKVEVVPVPGLPVGSTIEALRLAPEGVRIAMVIAVKGSVQLYVGTVARGGAQVRIDAAAPVSPVGVRVDDVAWNDELKLFLIGASLDTGEPQVTEVQVDGSLWTPHRFGDLPQAPDTITVAENQPAWVSAGGAVWVQSGGSWVSPTGFGETIGTGPVYLE
jgi:hypothetical protein